MKYYLGKQPESGEEMVEKQQTENLNGRTDAAEREVERAKAMAKNRKFLYEAKKRREPNAKHYIGNDGTATAVYGGKAVHFTDENGDLQETDNSLSDSGEALQTKANSFKTRFKKRSADGELFEMTKGKCRVGLSLRDMAKKCDCGEDNCTCETNGEFASKVAFKDAAAGADFEYTVDSDRVKENIIIKEKGERYEYDFELNLENLSVDISEDGKILQLKDKESGEVRFYIPAPFMYDAAGEQSDKVYYEITARDDESLSLKVIADGEWINAEGRAFPVTVDPQIVEKDSEIFSYLYQHRVEKYTSGSPYLAWETAVMPESNVLIDNEHRLFVYIDKSKFTMPKKSIAKAELCFESQVGNYYVQDKYYQFERFNGNVRHEITDLFKTGNGIIEILIHCEESGGRLFWDNGQKCQLSIEYLENETEPEKKSFSLCGGGVSELNLTSGEAVLKLPDLQVGDETIPFALFHVHKLSDNNFRCGNDWRLNLHQTLTKSGNEYVYTDENGWKHIAEERLYIVRDGRREKVEYYSKMDSDGTLTYIETLYNKTQKVHKVYRELQTKDGLRVITRLDGNQAQYIEQRESEEKQAEESVSSYKNALEDLRRVYDNGTIYSTIPDLTSDNLPSFLSSSSLILSSSEAAQFSSLCTNYNVSKNQLDNFSVKKTKTILKYEYEIITEDTEEDDPALLRQKSNLNEQVNALKKQIDAVIKSKKSKYEYACSLYKEYLVKKQELTQIQRQLPTSYVMRGEEILCFNRFGNLCAVMNGAGAYIEVLRGDIVTLGGKVEAITAVRAGERCADFTYDADGILKSVTDSNGFRADYSYSNGVLTKISYSNGEYVNISYTGDDITKISEGKYEKSTLTYANGKLKGVCNSNNVSSISDGKVTESQTENALVRAAITYGDGYVKIATDDDSEYVMLDKNNQVYASYEKKNGKVHGLRLFANMTGMYSMTVTPKKVAKKQSAQGTAVDYDITNAMGVLPDIAAFPDMTDEYNNLSEADWEMTEYDDFNRPVKTYTNWRYLGKSTAGKAIYAYARTEYSYDPANINKDCLKKKTTQYVNYNGNKNTGDSKQTVMIEEYSYNDFNKLCRTESYVEGEENESGISVTEKVYDDKGNVVREISYNTLDSSTKFYTESEVDEDGRTTAEIDETGENRTRLEYTKGQVGTRVLPNGGRLSYGYDEGGNVTAITQSTDGGEENSTSIKYTLNCPTVLTSGNTKINYEYDYRRRKTAVIINGEAQERYTYEEGANEDTVTKTTANEDTFVTVSDKGGNVIKVSCGENVLIQNAYDTDDKLLTSEDKVTGKTAKYTYDGDGALTEYACGELTESYIYNDDRNIGVKTLTGEVNHAYGYYYKDNAAKDLDYVLLPINNSDKNVRCYPQKDLHDRNTGKILTDDEGQKLYGEYITYLKRGDRATNMPATVYFGTLKNGKYVIGENLKYKYDSCGNIAEISENGKLFARYEYDSLNRLVREDNKKLGKTFFYTYDNCGNILSKKVTAYTRKPEDEICEFAEEKQYLYDGDKLTSYDGLAIEYDLCGNPTSYRGKTLAWQYGKRLINYDGLEFAYDGNGRRIKKGNITYTYDAENNVIKQSDGTNTLEFIYDTNGLSGFKHNGKEYVYRKNVQGDIIAIQTLDGEVKVCYTYDAWGNHGIIGDETLGGLNPFRYRSYLYDEETDLYYLQTRYYDPETGRFISQDSVEYLDPEHINGLNLYAYCSDNPVMRTDPNGNAWWHWLIGAIIIVGLAVAVVCTAGAAGVGVGAAFAAGFTGSTLVAGAGGSAIAATACTILTSAFAGAVVSAGLGFVAGGLSYESGSVTWNWESASEGFGFGALFGAASGAILSNPITSKIGSSFGRIGKQLLQAGVTSTLSGTFTALQGLASGGINWDDVILSVEFGAVTGALGGRVFNSNIAKVLQSAFASFGLSFIETGFSEFLEWLRSRFAKYKN